MIDSASLGVQIGPINSGCSACADDVLGMSDEPDKLQNILNLADHYGRLYWVKYGADKCKVVVSGADCDRQYYADIQPWTLNGEYVKVVDDNEHLGQIISGQQQKAKNIDLRLSNARKSLFGMLGAGFSYKCKISPGLKIHLFNTFTSPILLLGLSTFCLTQKDMEPLSLFHRKCMKSFLHLRQNAPTPAVHFILGALTIEAKLHFDIFSVFYSVWSNPQTKIHQIIKYLLETSHESSKTWASYVIYLCQMYNMKKNS